MTKKDLEKSSGGGDREDWFEAGGCPELNKVERWNASNSRKNEVNLAIPAKGTTSDKN